VGAWGRRAEDEPLGDLLVGQTRIECAARNRANPAHRRAKLLACTEAGYWAIRQIALVQRPWANRVGAEIGAGELNDALHGAMRLIAALETESATPHSS
jgi:hypothetical protein